MEFFRNNRKIIIILITLSFVVTPLIMAVITAIQG